MEKLIKVIDAMENQAVKENKTDEFLQFCRQLKDNIFIKMLSGTCTRAEAEHLRDYIISKEGNVRNALQRI